MKIYDISQEVFSCNVFPGDPTPKNETLCSMDSGDAYNLTAFSMCAHNGTHIDAPRHFIDRGAAVDDLPLECFVGDCYLARCEGDVTEEKALEIMKRAKEAQADERILLAQGYLPHLDSSCSGTNHRPSVRAIRRWRCISCCSVRVLYCLRVSSFAA